jgi:hypothetical protein
MDLVVRMMNPMPSTITLLTNSSMRYTSAAPSKNYRDPIIGNIQTKPSSSNLTMSRMKIF